MDDVRPTIPPRSTGFLHQVQQDLRDKGYAYQTEKTYLHWIRRYILFHNKHHPAQMRSEQISAFLCYYRSQRDCSLATQRITLKAIFFLYRKFLKVELERLDFEMARGCVRVNCLTCG